MEALWFCIVSLMLVIYAILDGFDLGAGVIHLFITRTESDRRSVLAAIGPFWDGYEIWLLLAGGALYCAFPAIYASRGFYLAAIALLWLLIIRGIGMEFRNRVKNPQRRRTIDITFAVASMLLALALGTAVGYLIISVPFSGSAIPGWFPILCGICALAILTMQSASWMALKSSGELQVRCRRLASAVWWAVLLWYAGVTAASLEFQPHVVDNLLTHSWISIFAVMALAGLIGARLCLSVGFDLGVFVSASCAIAGLMTSVAAGQFPYLLNATPFSPPGLTVYGAGANSYGMSISAIWWIPAFVLAGGYNIFMHHMFKRGMSNSHQQPAMSALK
jgi:cytochrome d ubiquinol oxidase subunit II